MERSTSATGSVLNYLRDDVQVRPGDLVLVDQGGLRETLGLVVEPDSSFYDMFHVDCLCVLKLTLDGTWCTTAVNPKRIVRLLSRRGGG